MGENEYLTSILCTSLIEMGSFQNQETSEEIERKERKGDREEKRRDKSFTGEGRKGFLKGFYERTQVIKLGLFDWV